LISNSQPRNSKELLSHLPQQAKDNKSLIQPNG